MGFHAAFFGKTFDPFFMFPMFPNLVFIVIIRSAWFVSFGRIPHCHLLYVLILDNITGGIVR